MLEAASYSCAYGNWVMGHVLWPSMELASVTVGRAPGVINRPWLVGALRTRLFELSRSHVRNRKPGSPGLRSIKSKSIKYLGVRTESSSFEITIFMIHFERTSNL